MKKRTYLNHDIYLDLALLDRLRPILSQRKKDNDPIKLHTPDCRTHQITFTGLIHEAIELYADLFLPLPTTPPSRLSPELRRARDDGLLHHWNEVSEHDRHQFIITLARRLSLENHWKKYFPDIA